MAPRDAELAAVEVACLRTLDGALPIATPRLVDAGHVAGWPYVRMTRLPGLELTEAWPMLGCDARFSLATQLGEALAMLHAIAPQRLFAIAMLHRYANLGWYHRRLGGPLNHAGLAAAWFGAGAETFS